MLLTKVTVSPLFNRAVALVLLVRAATAEFAKVYLGTLSPLRRLFMKNRVLLIVLLGVALVSSTGIAAYGVLAKTKPVACKCGDVCPCVEACCCDGK